MSEFRQLSDLAIDRGIKHSQLIDFVHSAVLDLYIQKYPKGPIDAHVVVDETSGLVRIYSAKSDITPAGFGPEAESLARQVIISLLTATPQLKSTPVIRQSFSFPKSSLTTTFSNFLYNAIFWGYNALFLLFIFMFVVSLFDTSVRHQLLDNLGSVGAVRTLLFASLVCVPVLSVTYALKNKLYDMPRELAKLFFVLEVPLLFLLYFPLSLSLTLSLASWFFLTLLLLVPFILYSYAPQTRALQDSTTWQTGVRMCLEQLVAMSSSYLSLLFSFYVPLILGNVAQVFFSNIFSSYYYGLPDIGDIVSKLFAATFGLIALLLVALAILLPFFISYIFWRSFFSTRQHLIPGYTPSSLRTFNFIFAGIIIFVFLALSYQRDTQKYLTRLADLRASSNFEVSKTIAAELYPHKEELRQSILDLANHYRRYLFTKDDTSLKYAYQQVFGLGESTSELIQNSFLVLAYPFVYQGGSTNYSQSADNFYYLFGDYPQSYPNYMPPVVQSVKLSTRTIAAAVSPNVPVATVSIEDAYLNTQWNQQEVVYEFTLPSEAVITDLKLGPNLEYPGVIAPKGAARNVYEREVRKSRDPVLLEYVGPGKYRLRVFPIPGKSDTSLGGQLQKIKFTYLVGLAPLGVPLPVITLRTNLSETDATYIYYVNSKLVTLPNPTSHLSSGFVMPDLCGSNPGWDVTLTSVVYKLVPNRTLLCDNQTSPLSSLAGRRSIALILDISATNKQLVDFALVKDLLKSNPAFLTTNTVTLYELNDVVTNKVILTPSTLDGYTAVYFGKPPTQTQLASLDNLNDITIKLSNMADLTLQLVTSDLQLHPGNLLVSPNWIIEGTPSSDFAKINASLDNPLSVLAANALLQDRIRTIKPLASNLPFFDAANAYATRNRFVTQYSSLISLVNDQQKQNLEQEAQNYDRYHTTDTPPPQPIGPMPINPFQSSKIMGSPALDTMELGGGGGGLTGITGPSSSSLISRLGSSLFVIFTFMLSVLGLGIFILPLVRRSST